jgi:formylglycine-generating enzyme required for sulfatase activity
MGLGFLGALTYFSSGDPAYAKSCSPGQMNASATCDCPAGYRSVGAPGDASCQKVIIDQKVPTGPVTTTVSDKKLPADAGSSVPVKSGSFMMGDAVSAGAGPVRQVTVGDYGIDKYEVSVEEYKKCVDTGVCSAPPSSYTSTQPKCNWGTARTAHPMNCVNYQEASNYCLWKGKRLPTEAEWEYAARGKGSTLYPWGIDTPTCAHANWTEKPSAPTAGCGESTSPIGSKPKGKSAAGAFDMAGNVEEWTFDWYGTFKGGSATNPGGPLTGTSRVVKGSAYDLSSPSDQIAARREGVDPTHREPWLGFRCATGASPNATPAFYNPPTPPPAPTTSPTYTPPPTFTTPSTAPSDLGTMVKIPGGTYSMGSTEDVEATPVRQVTLSSFHMDKYEVTVGEYRKCVTSGACLTPINSLSTYCNYDKSGKDAHPVNCVEWSDAKKYCSYVGKRLPTEAEWEFAARGLDSRKFPWGNNNPTCSQADFKNDSGLFCSGSGTSPVGKHPLGISFWGVHDLGGNIEEWVYDYWGKYTIGPLVNPSGPYSGTDHVVRGGNWEIESKYMRTFARWHFGQAKYWIGFRCAKTAS